MKRLFAALISTALLLCGSLAAAAPAAALSCKPTVPRGTCTVSEVKRISTKTNQKGRQLGSCRVTTANSTCTVSLSTSATRTVQSDFGLSADWVSGKLGITASKTSTISTSCTSPKLKAGQTYSAWVNETVYTYRIHQYKTRHGLKISNVLTTRQPKPNGIICG
ncbi:hypothetical protein ACFSYH_11115 [Populibacterium corticicola]|uniref:Uncharacterized protein n=1 Tax=Populibacterium corticicola TaxID=1812826 RepID=A0ABW5XGK9_9MICO